MNVHFIIHEAYEGPGALLKWAEEKNYTVTNSKVYLGEALPSDSRAVDLLIILGGPQCPATTTQECHYFKANDEMAFILDCIEKGKVVLGFCLGAQLIGEALGAKFEQSPHK